MTNPYKDALEALEGFVEHCSHYNGGKTDWICDKSNTIRKVLSEADKMREALLKIVWESKKPYEDDYKYTANRMWHIANDALSNK